MMKHSDSGDEGSNEGQQQHPAIMALLNVVRDTLQANGMEHGTASVVALPDETFVVVARPLDEKETDEGTFVPGGGTFGGGGASGHW